MTVARSHNPNFKLLLRDLELGPATLDDLQAVLGIARHNVRFYVKLAHANRMVHIIGWERRRGAPQAVYAIGEGGDSRRPAAFTSAETSRRHRQKRAGVHAQHRL